MSDCGVVQAVAVASCGVGQAVRVTWGDVRLVAVGRRQGWGVRVRVVAEGRRVRAREGVRRPARHSVFEIFVNATYCIRKLLRFMLLYGAQFVVVCARCVSS